MIVVQLLVHGATNRESAVGRQTEGFGNREIPRCTLLHAVKTMSIDLEWIKLDATLASYLVDVLNRQLEMRNGPPSLDPSK